MTRGLPSDTDDVFAAIERVKRLTLEIDAAVVDVDGLLGQRLTAVHDLLRITDVRLLMVDEPALDVVITSSGAEPPFLTDLILLSVHQAGNVGANEGSITSALRHRLGRRLNPGLIRHTLVRLASEGRILDRSSRYYAPNATIGSLPADPGPSIKTLILEALQGTRVDPAKTMRASEVRDVIRTTHRREVKLSTINPILRRLLKAGRVVHRDEAWALAEENAGNA